MSKKVIKPDDTLVTTILWKIYSSVFTKKR